MYHFISGYTAKVAGTEMGIKEPMPSFSSCFGEAFLPRHPYLYAKMLAEKLEKHGSDVWLVNTGWSGGKYGIGKRMSLKVTRKIIDGIHSGELTNAQYKVIPGFGLHVPTSCEGVDSSILDPVNTWEDKRDFDVQAKQLAAAFVKNMQKYAD